MSAWDCFSFLDANNDGENAGSKEMFCIKEFS